LAVEAAHAATVEEAAAPLSEAQRRGSPVRWIEAFVEPW
jgi:hypothetical protein